MSCQAIVTKYHGPTNSTGARITAKAAAGRVTLPYTYDANADELHARAAMKLASKMGWTGNYVAGGMPDDTGNVYVRAPIAVDPDASAYSVDRDGFTIPRDRTTGEALPLPDEMRRKLRL